MGAGERTTGTCDEHYDLISVLYHALHGVETAEEYALDAEAVGDQRLATFFREVQATQRQLAERAKGLLGIGDAMLEVGGVPPGVAPPETSVTFDTPPGNVEPRPAGIPPDKGTSPVTGTPNEGLAPPEEAVPPDAPSPPDEEQPPRAGPYLPGSPSSSA